jgi:hypothetical protein
MAVPPRPETLWRKRDPHKGKKKEGHHNPTAKAVKMFSNYILATNEDRRRVIHHMPSIDEKSKTAHKETIKTPQKKLTIINICDECVKKLNQKLNSTPRLNGKDCIFSKPTGRNL